MEQNKKHTMQIEYGQGFLATAVGEVVAFNERGIRLRLATGEKVCVCGENLKINAFNKQLGDLRVAGAISVVKYSYSAKQKIRNLFS